MSQRERDRLKVLTEAKDRLLTQKQAASQLDLSERQVRRLVSQLRQRGDRAVVHGLRGRASNRRIDSAVEKQAITELRNNGKCHDFGPSYAAEHLKKQLNLTAGKDTVRKWMMTAGLWQSRKRKVEAIHQWRERRSCQGELVQWDTCVHDWLEGRGKRCYLIAMIDDASSRVFARFVEHDTAEQNMLVVRRYLERYGRPLAFYTDKAAMFEVSPKQQAGEETASAAPTQITRALAELGIERISAHSPQAKGRIERFFETAQDRLVKGLRLAGACTLEAANAYLETEFLPDWEKRFTVAPLNSTDAHRPLTELHDLAASLSHVEMRTVTNDYTVQFKGKRYQIARGSIEAGMKGQSLRVEARLDGTVAVRFHGKYLEIAASISREVDGKPVSVDQAVRKDHNRGGRSRWMRDYPVNSSPPLWKALRTANETS